jgi:hypothetical protein
MKDEILTYEDTIFFKRLSTYGIGRLVKSFDFLISIIIGVFFLIIAIGLHMNYSALKELLPVFITVSAAMVAIAITGLSIIAGMADVKFIKELQKVNIYENLLFLFWYSTIISAVSIFFNTLFFLITTIYEGSNESFSLLSFCSPVSCAILILFFLSLFLVFYSIFTVIWIVGTTMRFGIYRGLFIQEEIIK